MYYKLFNAVCDVIEELKEAQLETEEIYINISEDEDEDDIEE